MLFMRACRSTSKRHVVGCEAPALQLVTDAQIGSSRALELHQGLFSPALASAPASSRILTCSERNRKLLVPLCSCRH